MIERRPDEPRRLHPSSLVFNLSKWIVRFIVPGIIVLFLGRGQKWEVWLMAFFLFAMVSEIYRYLTLRYLIADDEIIVRAGLLFRNERHIPFERIQNIDLVQNALQRLAKVAEVRIETAGGAKPEAVLSVLHIDEVNTMRRRVFADQKTQSEAASETADEVDPGDVIIKVPTADLVRLGLVTNRGWALVAILFGLAWEFGLTSQFRKLGSLTPNVETWSWPVIFIAGILFILSVMSVLYAFSIAWTILRLHGYTLRRVGDDLQLQCGLLTRRTATIPRHRVQFVSIQETVLHRRFGRVTIKIETAAGVQEGDIDGSTSLSQKWFIPIVAKSEVPRILAQLPAKLEIPEASDWRPMSGKGRGRYMKKMLIFSLLITLVLGGLVWRPWGLLIGLGLVPLALWHGHRATRYLAWAAMNGGIFFRSGAWTRRLSMAFDDTLQIVSMKQSPFDRRYDHARLHFDTAGAGPAGHRISIPYLDVGVVRTHLDQYARRMEAAALRQ